MDARKGEEGSARRLCPICGVSVPSIGLERHVNQHLDDEETERDRKLAERIGELREQDRVSEVVMNEEASTSNPNTKRASNRKSDNWDALGVDCNQGCGRWIPIAEWEDHCAQHELEVAEAAARAEQEEMWRGGTGNTPDSPMVDSKGGPMRQTSGGMTASKDGVGDDLVPPSGPKRPGPDLALLLITCKQAGFVQIREGLTNLLRQCLEFGGHQNFTRAALSGPVVHFESKAKQDLGWGCGWRNIQMLTSNLMIRNEETRRALFGGIGFVPDIPDLQMWLEIAWARGFDVMGAEQLGWEVYNTHKWIGTTECAALLRSFGLRARIVDFKAGEPPPSRPPPGRVHPYHQDRGPRPGSQTPPPYGRASGQQQPGPPFALPPPPGRHSNFPAPGGALPECKEQRSEGLEQFLNRRGREGGSGRVFAEVNRSNAEVALEQAQRWDMEEERGGAVGASLREEDENAATVHYGVQCDGCQAYPIRGPRFKSTSKEYDLCAACMDTAVQHPHSGLGQQDSFVRHDKPLHMKTEYSRPGKDAREGIANHMQLVEWVWQYFTQDRTAGPSVLCSQTVHMSSQPPLYFQHQGHSRTIVGIERRRRSASAPEECFLLILDPSQKTEELASALRERRGWQKLVKRGVHTLRKAEYQLCYVEPGIVHDEAEMQSLKVLDSVLHSCRGCED